MSGETTHVSCIPVVELSAESLALYRNDPPPIVTDLHRDAYELAGISQASRRPTPPAAPDSAGDPVPKNIEMPFRC